MSRRLVLAAVLAAAALAPPLQSPARAACHDFQISVRPSTVPEGGTVEVTVTRDAGLNPSSIDVTSVDESARAGADYPAVRRTVAYTTETSQTFDLAITDDTGAEGPESFRLHLSNPQGCAINPEYEIGPDARVTILTSDDGATTTTPTTGAPTSTTSAPTTTTSTSTTTSTTATTAPAATAPTSTSSTAPPFTALPPTTFPPGAAPTVPPAGGPSDAAVLLLLLLAVLAVVSGSTYWVYRRRAAEAA